MGKYKNKSGGRVQVSFLDLRTVEDGEVAELPDFQAGHGPDDVKAYEAAFKTWQEAVAGGDKDTPPPVPVDLMEIAWPENRWEPVADAPASKKAAK